MTFESDLFTVLKSASATLLNGDGTARVFPDFAPVTTARPYVTYQGIGGPILQQLSNAAPGVRLPEIQVTVWADTRAQSLLIARAIEAAMRAATTFFAAPVGEPVADFDADVPVYGCRQDFRCRHDT
jgi:hypothetical protein